VLREQIPKVEFDFQTRIIYYPLQQYDVGVLMSSFRICSNCYGYRVYPWMGFMTGERYQCQDCEEILVLPLEFDSIEAYLEFLKIQSPEKFAEVEDARKE
jgi:hypothetical protein